jgi:hypothetical protein
MSAVATADVTTFQQKRARKKIVSRAVTALPSPTNYKESAAMQSLAALPAVLC